jgi:hypothetical protein
MFQQLKKYSKENPLQFVMILAVIARLAAAIFSQGYGMHDDHFTVIEAPFSWTQGRDYDNWFPWNQVGVPIVSGHSLFYPGINYFLFTSLKAIHITDPKSIMFIVRFLLGLFSLVTVYYGYKITEKLSGTKSAYTVGLMLAILWFMPFMSVRTLVEVISTPFYILCFWLILKSDDTRKSFWILFLAGFIGAISISVRFQSAIVIAGIGLALLINKKFFSTLAFGTGALVSFLFIQGGIDIYVWGRPFTEFAEYFRYNLASKDAYGTDNVWMYLQLILGLLIPPVSIFLLVGFFKTWRKHLELFLPVFLFLAFHTIFSNRQERFILPVLPLIPVLGIIGWHEIVTKSQFWTRNKGFLKGSFKFFWIVNIILLIPITISSSKKSRVDVMYYFADKNQKINSILVEDLGRKKGMMLPVFYAGKAINTTTLVDDNPEDTCNYSNLDLDKYLRPVFSMKVFQVNSGIDWPQYIIFVGDIDLDKRIIHMKEYFPDLKHEFDVPPSMLDKVMKKLNPANKNESFYIYSTGMP